MQISAMGRNYKLPSVEKQINTHIINNNSACEVRLKPSLSEKIYI